MLNKKVLVGALAGVAVVAAALVGYRVFGWGVMGPVNSLKLDLSRPDALVRTKSLSTLPRDLLTVPLARDVLREDFLFYYEQSEDRLGLKGSLRRIAYEHALGWGDQLLRMVLDQPAEVALWRDADGSLKHFAIAVSRNQLTRLLEEAGKIALKDTQMCIAGSGWCAAELDRAQSERHAAADANVAAVRRHGRRHALPPARGSHRRWL
ncbi:DUF2138 family protein [Janthinobacterium sp. GB4P2]|uniref:DUF2138 family protein n=1 Tax=Janthinobacterium sp. GB4P2 TaxID=3424189 RepID=UPI003F20568C